MSKQRKRPFITAAIVLVAVWALAWSGYSMAQRSKVTPEKVREYLVAVDLEKLSPAERQQAIQKLASMVNQLPNQERRELRGDVTTGKRLNLGATNNAPTTNSSDGGTNRPPRDVNGDRWFKQMNDDEKAMFIEATFPTGFKRMIEAFEKLPSEQRQKAVAEALKRLRDARAKGQLPGAPVKPNDSPISKELQDKITAVGLKTFYSQSSAQTKAELAPLLDELQRAMQSGRAFR
ncbi:MAG: hypothetical protein EXS29_07030 [Pedosphaera sp.]|nr:hypothetical protein [Pedosphaera sp.]MST01047.1 hypothetical protein [Pedosphaera sp.]